MILGSRRFSKEISVSSGFDKKNCEALVTLASRLSLTDTKTDSPEQLKPHVETGKTIIFSQSAPKEKKETLADVMFKHKIKQEVLSKEQINLLVMKCAEQLQLAHLQRKIHGDIKPSQFIVNMKGSVIKVKLVGFDPAYILKPNENFIIPPIEEERGTVGFIAPEVAKQGKYSFKSDIFAFGCVLNDLVQSGFGKRFNFLYKQMCKKAAYKNPELRKSLEDTIQFINDNKFEELKETGERIGRYRVVY